MKIELSDLSPLIEASDRWRYNREHEVYWLTSNKGKLSLGLNRPEEPFAKVVTCKNIQEVQEEDLPTCYVEWPSGKHTVVLPSTWDEKAPILNRPYLYGKWDCYTLIVDYMKDAKGITMEPINEPLEKIMDNFSNNAFLKNNEMYNWEKVTNPSPGDGILFSVNSKADSTRNPNHCGVYLGDNRFIHHYPNRVSCVETLDSTWKSWIVTYMRYKHG